MLTVVLLCQGIRQHGQPLALLLLTLLLLSMLLKLLNNIKGHALPRPMLIFILLLLLLLVYLAVALALTQLAHLPLSSLIRFIRTHVPFAALLLLSQRVPCADCTLASCCCCFSTVCWQLLAN
jgi:glucan phosphoethanolaminetransferase (alkaline phosphatase superfamily)